MIEFILAVIVLLILIFLVMAADGIARFVKGSWRKRSDEMKHRARVVSRMNPLEER